MNTLRTAPSFRSFPMDRNILSRFSFRPLVACVVMVSSSSFLHAADIVVAGGESLADKLTAAVDGDTIILTGNPLPLTTAVDFASRSLTFKSSDLSSGDPLTWRTVSATGNGTASGNVFSGSEGRTWIFDHLTITGGVRGTTGGGLFFNGGSAATITTLGGSFQVTGNRTTVNNNHGGGMYSAASQLLFTGDGAGGGAVLIRNNSAGGQGGGIWAGQVVFADGVAATIEGNKSGQGASASGSGAGVRSATTSASSTVDATADDIINPVAYGIIFGGDTLIKDNRAGTTASSTGVNGGGANTNSGGILFKQKATIIGNITWNTGAGLNIATTALFKGDAVINDNRSVTTLASGDSRGGGIFAGGLVTFEKAAVLKGNSVNRTNGTTGNTYGGGIASNNTTDGGVNFKGFVAMENNISGSVGGAIWTNGRANALTVTGGTHVYVDPVTQEITSYTGSVFLNNKAAVNGGAIYLAGDTAVTANFNAIVGDITFQGNRQGVTIEVTSEVPAASGGTANAIYVNSPSATTFTFDAGAGRAVNFYDPINSNGTGVSTVIKNGAGTILFDTHNTDLAANTTVNTGTFQLDNGAVYGRTNTLGSFDLKAGAVLSGSGQVVTDVVTLRAGSTAQVTGGGTLKLDATTRTLEAGVILGGSGTLDFGAAPVVAGTVVVGTPASTTAQNLTLTSGLTLGDSVVKFDLFSGNANPGLSSNDKLSAASLALNNTNKFDFNSFNHGTYTLISTAGGITGFNPASFTTSVNGVDFTSGRAAAAYSLSGNDLVATLTTQNALRTWNGAANGTWDLTATNWAEGDARFLSGDKVIFAGAAPGIITLGAGGLTVSDMQVSGSGNYTFSGGAITTDASTWGGTLPVPAPAGKLVKEGSGTLTLDTAANNFKGGVDINAGTLAISNPGQLGTTLANVRFLGGAGDQARIGIQGATVFDGTAGNQRLAVAAGNSGGFSVADGGALTFRNSNTAGNGGALAVASGGSVTIAATGSGATAFGNNTAGGNGGAIYNAGTLNLAIVSNDSYSGNTAASGGFLYMADGAVATIDVAAGKSLSLGAANNATAIDSIASANATAVINKLNAGSLVLNSDSSAYVGAVNVGAGSLMLGNSGAKLGGIVSVASGATFGGSGTATGSASFSSGSFLQIGALGSPTAQALTFSGPVALTGTTLKYDIYSGDISDAALSVNDRLFAGSLSFGGSTVFDLSALLKGKYTIASTTGGITGFDPANISTLVNSAVSASSRIGTIYSVNGNDLELLIDVQNGALTWQGGNSKVWDISTANWTGADTFFVGGDRVRFDSATDSGDRSIVIAAGGVTVADVTVTGGGDYTFTGGGLTADPAASIGIVGPSGKFIMNGTGTVVLDNAANNFTSGITVNSGTLQGNAATLNGPILNNSILVFQQGGDGDLPDGTPVGVDGVYSGTISGTGTLVKSGLRQLALTGSVTAGKIVINAGTLAIQPSTAIRATTDFMVAAGGTLSGSGTVTTPQFIHAGALRVSGPESGFGTLSIDGNYVGNNGTIFLRTLLDDGKSPQTDALVITGNTSGTAGVNITNQGGAGAYTGKIGEPGGIKVIDVKGVSGAEFYLSNRAVAGIYEYELIEADDGGWYLRSDEPSPEILAGSIVPAISKLLGEAGMDSLQQRLGELRANPSRRSGAWVRGLHKSDRIHTGILENTDIHSNAVQFGLAHSSFKVGGEKGVLSYGVFGDLIRGSANLVAENANVSGVSMGAGVFATYQKSSWYSDLALKQARNKYQIRAVGSIVNVSGKSQMASFETGYGFAVRRLGWIEPQAQVLYAWYPLDDTGDRFTRNYHFQSTDSLMSRAGVRWHNQFDLGKYGKAAPWLRASAGYESRARYALVAAGTPFENDLGGYQYTVDGGIGIALTRDASLYTAGSWTKGEAVDNYTISGGLRFSW